ncbi:PA2169 family four-helix-bundle protein [Subsaximicrobium wynnwilliamsii]|uniref:PA2169 family four-helix-bundle protein n=1 Tax=Subsaximicrobium wynnwilliamsii TaxID=291179 RepID=A0A5C6ZNU8_9FLAO|nr:PA2169 family four-helix-bundle protein [Subsaximicrobium wynnwilliamsii]TXD85202.1 PA2169 family four-helix-bundle protein [Subsaximicrobium wynnwilliamsii]TXD91245.1 PA2169 family four-helix-bundle protein [Subsaximicrobium wynnwilliamsii]TXE04638.1 PA2169 family four-helix-bundle protein [Subsaximicrobium wynnwilliamsii]
MSTYTEEVGKKLNELLEKTYDAEKGFKNAAEQIEHPALKSYFNQKAQERYNFGHELKTEIKSFGQEVDKGGSLTGSAHRAWMNVKALFSGDNEESMLEEAITGEKASVEEYNEVLQETSLPSSTRSILNSQKQTIETGLSNIKNLEDLRDSQ